jgi:hypothetical protein
MNRAEVFYKRLHQAIGLTVQKNDSHANMTEAVIMHTLQAGYHCLEQQQRAEAERAAQLAEVVE